MPREDVSGRTNSGNATEFELKLNNCQRIYGFEALEKLEEVVPRIRISASWYMH